MPRIFLCAVIALALASPAYAAAPAFGWLARLIASGMKAAPKAAPLLPKAAPIVPKAAPGLLGAPFIDDAARAVPKGGALGETGTLADDAAKAGGGAAEEGGGGSVAEDVLSEIGQQGVQALGDGQSRDRDERRPYPGIEPLPSLRAPRTFAPLPPAPTN